MDNIAVRGTRKTTAKAVKGLRVRIEGAKEDLPRLVEVRGPVADGELTLILRPRDVEGLAVIAPANKGPVLVWETRDPGDSDAPGPFVSGLEAPFWQARLHEARRNVRGLARAVVAGTWAGSVAVEARQVSLTLTREWSGHGRLTVHNVRNGWVWRMARAAAGGEQKGQALTLALAVEAGLAAASNFHLRRVCAMRPAPEAKARAPRTPKAESAPAPEARARAPRTRKAESAPAPEAKARAPRTRKAKNPADQDEDGSLLLDGQGRRYRVRLRVAAAALDGSGPVVPSNHPRTMRPVPDYPLEFQARSLESFAETAKIRQMARELEPERLLVPHSDATLGPPVVWPPGGARCFVLAGNGRLLALLQADENAYRRYVEEGRRRYPVLWPSGSPPAGARWVLVRELYSAAGDPLDRPEAEAFAGASQASTSAAESPLGRAMSVLRGLGLRSLTELPPMVWRQIITADNIGDFVASNRAFVGALLQRLDGAQARKVQAEGELLADLVSAVLVASLPDEIRRGGFVSEKEERALLGALPILVTLSQAVARRAVRPAWDLAPRLVAARDFAERMRGKSDSAALVEVERAAAQEQLVGVKTLWDELPALGVLLGLVLKRASRTRDPALTVESLLGPYLDSALQDVPGQSSMFGAPPDPAQALASILKVALPRKVRAA